KVSFDQKIVDKVLATNEIKTDTLSQSKPLNINLGEIHLKNFDVSYSDDNSKIKAHIIFEDFFTDIKKIDLQNNQYEVEKIDLTNADFDFLMFNQKDEITQNRIQHE